MQVIAHRGARRLAVENTLQALRIGLLEGADGVEFDVQLSKDGEPVLFHDTSLARCAGDDRDLADVPWRELRKLRLTDEFGHTGRIAHLDEALELLDGEPAVINAELKVARPQLALALAEAVAQTLSPALGDWQVSSFSRPALVRFANAATGCPLAPLVHVEPEWHWSRLTAATDLALKTELARAASQLGARFAAIHVHGHAVNERLLERWHAAGLLVRAWVVNEPDDWSHAHEAGVDAVITDDPTGAVAHLRGRQE